MSPSPTNLTSAGRSRGASAFTLVELLVSVAIFVLLMALLVGVMGGIARIWTDSTGRISQFRESRRAVEIVRNGLSQATLGTYWDYKYTGTGVSALPQKYVRQSNLRFVSGPTSQLGLPAAQFGAGKSLGEPVGHAVFFFAPLGIVADPTYRDLPDLLNALGFFISYGEHADLLPGFVRADTRYAKRERFRLFEMLEPAEQLTIYEHTSGMGPPPPPKPATPLEPKNNNYVGREWFTTPLGSAGNTRLVAENIVAMVLRPRLGDGRDLANGDFVYDSTVELSGDPNRNPRHQLPPVVELTLIAVDEASVARFPDKVTPAALSLSSRFQKPANYESDLREIEAYLRDNRINYRLFQTSVAILGAKWSTTQ